MKTYGDGKAGQWSKRQAEKQIDRMLMWIITYGVSAGMLIGVLIGEVLPRFRVGHESIMVVLIAVVGALLIKYVQPKLDGPIGEMAKERIRHLHGGQAEALVAYYLRSLGDEWHLFNGVKTSGGGDIDHVLVGPAGIYCVSTKSHRGLYAWDAATRRATLNGKPTDHVFEAQNMAMQLRHWLEARVRPEHGLKAVPFVHPVLCIPLAAVDLPSAVTRVRVIDAAELHDLLLDGRKDLSQAQVAGVVEVLKEITGTEVRA